MCLLFFAAFDKFLSAQGINYYRVVTCGCYCNNSQDYLTGKQRHVIREELIPQTVRQSHQCLIQDT
jgi:hypothetical protein